MAELRSLKEYLMPSQDNTAVDEFNALQQLVFPPAEVVAEQPKRKPTQNSSKTTVENNKKTPHSKKEDADKEYRKNLLERSAGGVLGDEYEMNLLDLAQRGLDIPESYQVSPDFASNNPELAKLALNMARRLRPQSPEEIAQKAQEAASMVEYGLNPKEAAKGVKAANVPLSKRETMYPNYIPNPEEVGLLAGQAEIIRKATAPYSDESQMTNAELLETARQLLSEKMGKPYRNVNFELLDKLGSALGGWKPLGVENEPGPEKNLMLASQLADAKQKFESFQQKQAQDYIEGIQKTLAAGVLQATKPVRSTGAGELKSVEKSDIDKIIKTQIQPIEETIQNSKDLIVILEEMSKVGFNPLKISALMDAYTGVRGSLVTELKKEGGFGGALTKDELKLAQSQIPTENFIWNTIKSKSGFNVQKAQLEALISKLNEKSKYLKQNLNIAYSKGIENEYVKNSIVGAETAASQGSIYSAPKEERKLVKKYYSPTTNKTKLVYSDGSEEVVDGRR